MTVLHNPSSDACDDTGVGRRLFQESARQLQVDGFKSMMLWVLQENPTLDFYARMGGKTFATKTEVIGGKELIEVGLSWDNLSIV